MPTTTQDPNAHVPYEVDWSKWLTERGLDVTDVLSYTWVVTPNITKTAQTDDGVIARVYVKDMTLSERARVTCRISCQNPGGGDPIVDDFSIDIVGAHT